MNISMEAIVLTALFFVVLAGVTVGFISFFFGMKNKFNSSHSLGIGTIASSALVACFIFLDNPISVVFGFIAVIGYFPVSVFAGKLCAEKFFEK